MTPLPPDLLAWLAAPVERRVVTPLLGGAVSASVQRWTLRLADGRTVDVVRKAAPPNEIAGLRAAQAVRTGATAVPELVAAGEDWLITPFLAGQPLAGRASPVPRNVPETLACLHARFLDAARWPAAVSRVDPAWWRDLCLGWVVPRLSDSGAAALVERAAGHPAVAGVLGRLPATLLHGDVHPGNVIVDGDTAALIDWGSCRIGPAMLDLANLFTVGDLAPYRRRWRTVTGADLDDDQVELGYRWAALQIPVQYLPWTAANRPAAEVAAALDRIERALAALP